MQTLTPVNRKPCGNVRISAKAAAQTHQGRQSSPAVIESDQSELIPVISQRSATHRILSRTLNLNPMTYGHSHKEPAEMFISNAGALLILCPFCMTASMGPEQPMKVSDCNVFKNYAWCVTVGLHEKRKTRHPKDNPVLLEVCMSSELLWKKGLCKYAAECDS